MKIVQMTPKQVEGNPNFWVLAVAEDAGRYFVYLRQHGVLLEDGQGKPLMDPLTKAQVVGNKDYIEETVTRLSLENNIVTLDLKWIDDELYVRQLQKFFYDNVFFKDILERNKREIDKILARGGDLPIPKIGDNNDSK